MNMNMVYGDPAVYGAFPSKPNTIHVVSKQDKDGVYSFIAFTSESQFLQAKDDVQMQEGDKLFSIMRFDVFDTQYNVTVQWVYGITMTTKSQFDGTQEFTRVIYVFENEENANTMKSICERTKFSTPGTFKVVPIEFYKPPLKTNVLHMEDKNKNASIPSEKRKIFVLKIDGTDDFKVFKTRKEAEEFVKDVKIKEDPVYKDKTFSLLESYV